MAAQQDLTPAPEPLLTGTFALYEDATGGMVIAYRTSSGMEGRRRFPRGMVRAGMKMARRAAAADGEDPDEGVPGGLD